MDNDKLKFCAVCGAPYYGSSCPNCGSRETEDQISRVLLDRCPCCGGDAEIICFVMEDENGDDHESFSVQCASCGLCTPLTNKESAVEIWNRRVPEW